MKWLKNLLMIVGIVALIGAGSATYMVLTAPIPGIRISPSRPVVQAAAASFSQFAKGRVVPIQSAALSFRAKGEQSDAFIAEVAVQVGDHVEQGAVLARLDTRDLQLQVDEAQANLDQVRIHSNRLPIDAEAERMRADANLANIEADANAAKMKAEAEAAKLRADANVALLYGRTTAASGLEASAVAVLQAASTQQANAVTYRNQIAAALDVERRNNASDIATAAAQIREAEANLKRAQLGVELATLRAPFAGTIADVNYMVGEVPSVTDAGFILMNDSGWQIEVANLTETSLVGIKVGDPVNIVFDAISELAIPGKVENISTIGTFTPGSISTTYKVLITLQQQDQRLRSDMSAGVTFLPASGSGDSKAAEPSSVK